MKKNTEHHVNEAITEAPVFTHEIINQLYCNSLKIDQQILDEILALPRESLFADLLKVVDDSKVRFSIYKKKESNIESFEFLIHAINLLVELKDERTLDVLLDILREDEEWIRFWLSDYFTEDFWEVLYAVANTKLDVLLEFVKEPNLFTYSKTCVSQMTSQIVLHQPERREEVVEWYEEIFEYWITNQFDEDLIDNEVIASFVSDVVTIRLTELESEIEELFEDDLVAEYISGSAEECVYDISQPLFDHEKRKIFNSITERYHEYTTTWIYYKQNNDDDVAFLEKEIIRLKQKIEDKAHKLASAKAETKPKVGRNDPCPCGSGKKYKKCCGN